MKNNPLTFANRQPLFHFINRWDIFLLLLILSILFFLGWAGNQMAKPYQIGVPLPISLDPLKLPGYALYTVLRMFIALFLSILFTLIIGSFAAYNRRAGQIIIPALDILQSVPILSFLSITIAGFIHLFPGSRLGPECACIFAIFTAQVWNITFSFYQSLKTIPADLREAAHMLHLSPWQRFWKIDVPFSLSGLIWNMMMSMSASWFFVVLSEAINVAHQDIRLPGVGSYISLAIQTHNLSSLGWAMLTMMVVIVLYDQILFRPLIAWSEKFKMDHTPDEEIYQSWLIDWMRNSQLLKRLNPPFAYLKEQFLHGQWINRPLSVDFHIPFKRFHRSFNWVWSVLIVLGSVWMGWQLLHYILSTLSIHTIFHVFLLGTITAARVLILIVISSLIWIPVGVWIGLRPQWAQRIQPVIQFVAAFPANLFYPLFVIAIVYFHLNVQIWITPLMILGTQWYILFNVIAGASMIPRDLYLAANNIGLKGWRWWKRLALPAIFPFYITGAITAAGGAWNASIVAECVSWGQSTLQATGLGAYIQMNTIAGNFHQIALGTSMMCLFVVVLNHLLWHPLYRLAQTRYTLQ